MSRENALEQLSSLMTASADGENGSFLLDITLRNNELLVNRIPGKTTLVGTPNDAIEPNGLAEFEYSNIDQDQTQYHCLTCVHVMRNCLPFHSSRN